jgi:hypothetical protein
MDLTPEQRDRVERLLYDCEDATAFRRELDSIKSAIELHEFSRQFNWDGGFDELEAVLHHRLCDRGTALMIYWLAEPVYFLDFDNPNDIPSVNLPLSQFVNTVRDMLLKNQFESNQIRFDPADVMSVGQRLRVRKESAIPPELTIPNC